MIYLYIKSIFILFSHFEGDVWSGTWNGTQVAVKKLSLGGLFTTDVSTILYIC
jgi:hypothetical protein